MSDTDIISELKAFFVICKFFGIICCDMVGLVGYRKFVYNQRGIISFLLKFLLFFIVFILGAVKKAFIILKNLQLEYIPELLFYFCYFLLMMILLYFEVFHQKEIVESLNQLQELIELFKSYRIKINYNKVKHNVFLITSLQLFYLFLTAIDFYIYSNYLLVIFYTIVENGWILIMAQFCLFLSVTKDLSLHLNYALNKTIFLSEAMNLHYELFQFCRIIEKFGWFFIIRILIGYATIVYILFTLCINSVWGSYEWWFVNNVCVLIYNFILISIATWTHTSTKNEVRCIMKHSLFSKWALL